MTNKETILNTIEYIEQNLKNDISVIDIANEGCYSLYHFIRLFTSIVGLPPNKYLHQRRLTECVNELKNSDKKISELAYDYLFNSPETFTRAFKKHFGTSPSKLRSGQHITSLSLTYPATAEYIYQSHLTKNQPPDLIDLNERVLVGISFFISEDEKIEDLSSQWGQLMNEAPRIPNKILPERFYQVQFWSENQDIGGLYFFIGVEVESTNNIEPQFVVKIIPKGTYLRFIHKGLANKVGYTYQYIYNQYLPDTNYKLNQPFNFEFYGKKCLGPYNEKSESEIYIPVLKG